MASRTRTARVAEGGRTGPAPWYREPWMWLVVSIPGAAVVMGVVMLFVAGRSYDGLVADDYYRRGLEINRSLERDRAAARHGLLATIEIFPDGASGVVSLAGNERFVVPGSLEIAFIHSTRAGLDRAAKLSIDPTGRFVGRWTPLDHGVWNLELRGGDWRLFGRAKIPGDGAMELAPGIVEAR